jgi:hypothetical protein
MSGAQAGAINAPVASSSGNPHYQHPSQAASQQQPQQGGQGTPGQQTGGANVTNQSGGVGPEPNAQGVKTFSIKL